MLQTRILIWTPASLAFAWRSCFFVGRGLLLRGAYGMLAQCLTVRYIYVRVALRGTDPSLKVSYPEASGSGGLFVQAYPPPPSSLPFFSDGHVLRALELVLYGLVELGLWLCSVCECQNVVLFLTHHDICPTPSHRNDTASDVPELLFERTADT